jgi:hypothetical protein
MPSRDDRWAITLLDLTALVVGFALAFSMMILPGVALRPLQALARLEQRGAPAWLGVLADLPAIGLPVVFSVATVVVLRRLCDGRPLRAPEWLTLVGGWVLAVLAFPGPDYDRHGLIRLGAELIACGAGGAMLAALGTRLPARSRAILQLALAGLFLWLPATRASLEVPQLIRYFFPPNQTYVVSALPYRRYDALLAALGLLPWGLAVGVPLAAALQSEWRSWSWTDWAGAGIVVLMLPSAVAMFVLSPYAWDREPLVLVLYFVAVGAGSIAAARGLGPWWSRRVGVRYDRGRPDRFPEGGDDHGTPDL